MKDIDGLDDGTFRQLEEEAFRLCRAMKPEDVANMVAFLSNEELAEFRRSMSRDPRFDDLDHFIVYLVILGSLARSKRDQKPEIASKIDSKRDVTGDLPGNIPRMPPDLLAGIDNPSDNNLRKWVSTLTLGQQRWMRDMLNKEKIRRCGEEEFLRAEQARAGCQECSRLRDVLASEFNPNNMTNLIQHMRSHDETAS